MAAAGAIEREEAIAIARRWEKTLDPLLLYSRCRIYKTSTFLLL